MSKVGDDYRTRAQVCADAARDASLANVRDSFLRSQRAFEGMADRTERIEAERAQRVAAADAARSEREGGAATC